MGGNASNIGGEMRGEQQQLSAETPAWKPTNGIFPRMLSSMQPGKYAQSALYYVCLMRKGSREILMMAYRSIRWKDVASAAERIAARCWSAWHRTSCHELTIGNIILLVNQNTIKQFLSSEVKSVFNVPGAFSKQILGRSNIKRRESKERLKDSETCLIGHPLIWRIPSKSDDLISKSPTGSGAGYINRYSLEQTESICID